MVRIPAAAARSVMDDDLRSKENWLASLPEIATILCFA
jgi:hypothetical protein